MCDEKFYTKLFTVYFFNQIIISALISRFSSVKLKKAYIYFLLF